MISDAAKLASRMRRPDIEEIKHATGRKPRPELEHQIEQPGARVFSIVIDDRVIGMFGVIPVGSDRRLGIGFPWMLGTDELFEVHWRQFVREGKQWLGVLSRGYSVLEGYTYARNELHLRWLTKVGFELLEVVPYGVSGRLFQRFRMVTLHRAKLADAIHRTVQPSYV